MSMTDHKIEYLEFQGTRVANVPDRPGLYAWYYRPTSISREAALDTLGKFFLPESNITTSITHRYGMRTISNGIGQIFFGADQQPVDAAINEAFDRAEPFLNWFFKSQQFVHFCRPVYIGIAKNLYDRVYTQHLLSLIDYWDDASRVSRYIAANSHATVQTVMNSLDMPHSFALEARVRGISSNNLMVSVLPTDTIPIDDGLDNSLSESSTRRALERFLQLLSDPICGRR
jgi:hypothetical protein